MWSKLFWKDVSERAVSTAAEVLFGTITAAGFNILNFDVVSVLVVAGVAALGVVLKSLGALARKGTVSPASLTRDDGGF